MKARMALLLSGAAALMAFNSPLQVAAAEPNLSTLPPVRSHADLLAPIPNSIEALRADDAAHIQRSVGRVQLAQYHHHHHHHSYHHHHHHHFGFGIEIGPPAYYGDEDCYWTWGRRYWNGYRWVRRRVRVCD